MRHHSPVEASELLREWASELALDRETIDAAFENAPLDFPVHFSSRLPLGADRTGAAGITLLGGVHLLPSVLSWPPLERILILRHEAEHIRQQRSEPLFYLRYAASWMHAMASDLFGRGPDVTVGRGASRDRSMRARFRRAYLAIPSEVEAYEAERAARHVLTRGLGGS